MQHSLANGKLRFFTCLMRCNVALPKIVYRVKRIMNVHILSLGTANPGTGHEQEWLLNHLELTDERTARLFRGGRINRRHLALPPLADDGSFSTETQGQLLEKHKTVGVEIGTAALNTALSRAGIRPDQLDFLCCVSSTGFLTPGFSALIACEIGLRADCRRLDVVGMGCHAGLNGLNAVSGAVASSGAELGALLCIEVCSAAYVVDGSVRTAVVNSLFGDGAAAAVLGQEAWATAGKHPRILSFRTAMIPGTLDAMRFDWDENAGKFSFFLDRAIPDEIGKNVGLVVQSLLAENGLSQVDIAHWHVHGGGKRVIERIQQALVLGSDDLRHSWSVIENFGNVSSGSVLFALESLNLEEVVRPGDYGLMITMGPGCTIETALIQW